MAIQQLHLNKKIFFTASENEVQKEIVINDEVVVSKIACGNLPFNNDVRDWWKAYLSQKQQAEVSEWSGKGAELKVAELFSGPGGLAQGVKSFCEVLGIRFRSIAAMDTNQDALRVYERNHDTENHFSENTEDEQSSCNWNKHQGDVTTLVSGNWRTPKVTRRVIDTHLKKGMEVPEEGWPQRRANHRMLITKWKKRTEEEKKGKTRPTLSVKEIDADYEHDKPEINEEGPWSRIKQGSFDLLLAGPPCQGHSNLNNHTRRDDEKNELYLIVPAVAIAWDIPLVIIENVEGVKHDVSGVVQQTEGIFKANGYQVERGVLDAAKIGWPQTRKRYFLIARKAGNPVPINEVMDHFSIPKGEKPLGVKDAFFNLENQETFTRGCDEAEKGENYMFTLPDYSVKEKARAKYHKAETLEDKLEIVNELKQIFLETSKKYPLEIHYNFEKAKVELQARSQDQLDDWNLPNRLHNETHWEATSYPTVYGRLDRDKPSGTITSGYMCSGRGRFTHPVEARTLTPREAARLQGFPDSYDWKPEDDRIPSATDIAQWIGDAVPMPLGYAAAYSVLGNGLDFK